MLEIREGQNTEMFDKFPFEQVERQSFSLIFQQEGIAIQLNIPVASHDNIVHINDILLLLPLLLNKLLQYNYGSIHEFPYRQAIYTPRFS